MLAYSTIANIGYIFFGVGIAPSAGLSASLLHTVNHMVTKVLLLLSAGVIIYATGTRDIIRLGGLYKRMPITTVCYIIGAFSLVGISPLNIFVSKWFLVLAALREASFMNILGVVLIVVTSAVSLAAQLRVIQLAFLSETKGSTFNLREPPLMLVPVVVLAALTIVFRSLSISINKLRKWGS